jgi:hypothetical protein
MLDLRGAGRLADVLDALEKDRAAREKGRRRRSRAMKPACIRIGWLASGSRVGCCRSQGDLEATVPLASHAGEEARNHRAKTHPGDLHAPHGRRRGQACRFSFRGSARSARPQPGWLSGLRRCRAVLRTDVPDDRSKAAARALLRPPVRGQGGGRRAWSNPLGDLIRRRQDARSDGCLPPC